MGPASSDVNQSRPTKEITAETQRAQSAAEEAVAPMPLRNSAFSAPLR
jgi:hypothetical protein